MGVKEGTMQIGDVLDGRYRIVGEGKPQDIGIMYKAYDSRYERLVVVLVLHPRFVGSGNVLERLTQSQQAVADLAVPALVPMEDAGVVGGQLYLVRALVDGYPLADFLARIGPLKFDVAVQITIRLCDALAPAHRVGLVHGSLSPFSVLVRDDGQVLVTDVGLLPALRPAAASPGRPWGRAPYLSPEQAAGETVHPSSDVYVIGSLLYEMLAGRPPFHGQDEAVLAVRHLRHDPPSLQVLVPNIPPPLAQIVQKALTKEAAARYRNASQLAHILRSQLGLERPELAVPQAAPRQERLVVPAPPIPEIYEPGVELDEWTEEAAGVDWLVVAFIVAALVAVLGLIPLWRTVYRRYAAPPVTPQPALYRPSLGDWAGLAPPSGEPEVETKAGTKLDDFGLVWYNLSIRSHPVFWIGIDDVDRARVQITTIGRAVWESRLRVLGAVYNTL
jgi:Protein kinase domain